MNIPITTNNIYNHAATLSFWAFVEDNTAFGENTFSVSFEKRLKIWVGSKSATKVAAYCIPVPDYYQNVDGPASGKLSDLTTKTQLETQKADAKKTVLFAELGANKDSLWFHVKCAYSLNSKKAYLTLHQKDGTAPINNEKASIKFNQYIEDNAIDYDFRDFNPTNSIKIKTSGSIAKAIYIKAVTAFIDFIPKNANYEYFK